MTMPQTKKLQLQSFQLLVELMTDEDFSLARTSADLNHPLDLNLDGVCIIHRIKHTKIWKKANDTYSNTVPGTNLQKSFVPSLFQWLIMCLVVSHWSSLVQMSLFIH
jgi:hypothetical protein